MALKTTSIYLLDPKWKVKSGFGLRSNGFLDDLLLIVFLATILIGLGINKWL